MSRYSRQISLPEIGISGQEKLQKAAILCVGAGGLGCPALQYLAAAGIGHIGIIDQDTVDESNLQRQILYSVDDIEKNKAIAAKDKLLALNPNIKITAYNSDLTIENVESIIREYDIVIDGTDNFSAKYLINDAAFKYQKTSIYGSILGFDGQLSTFVPGQTGCYRCLYPAPPKTAVANCAEAGVIGAVAGMIGTAQAMEAIKVILDTPALPTLAGHLYILDMHDLSTQKLSIASRENCPTCRAHPTKISLQSYDKPACSIELSIPEITIAEFSNNADTYTLIDVREEEEFASAAIPNAINHPLSRVMDGDHPDLPEKRAILLYCQKGMRSQQAGQILTEQGNYDLYSLAGGIEAYLDHSH